METTPPQPAGQRTLAAILFTDVVGFSGRMEENEQVTLALLRADIDLFGRIAGEHSGVILKSTGDGVLCYFNSAVEAVACAVAFQRELAEREPPPDGAPPPLQHRVGIHLGDVFVNENDVHGDGVNVAARIQAEADPGGICISQTVYDVVRNKLELRTTFLGERELKNLRTAIPIYSVLLGKDAASAQVKTAPRPKAPSKSNTSLMIAVGALAGALVVALAALFLITRSRANAAARAETTRTATVQRPLLANQRTDEAELRQRPRLAPEGGNAATLPSPRSVVEEFVGPLMRTHGRESPVRLPGAGGTIELEGWQDGQGTIHLTTPRGEVKGLLSELNERDFTYLAFALAIEQRRKGAVLDRRFIQPLRAYARAEGIRDPRIFQLADENSDSP